MKKTITIEEQWEKKKKRAECNEVGYYRSVKSKKLSFVSNQSKVGVESCSICEDVFDGEQWVQCDICNRWYHNNCINIEFSYTKANALTVKNVL